MHVFFSCFFVYTCLICMDRGAHDNIGSSLLLFSCEQFIIRKADFLKFIAITEQGMSEELDML